MLVLSRKLGQSVVIVLEDGREIEVTIVDRKGDVVQIGFLAPQAISVDRKEVHERKKAASA